MACTVRALYVHCQNTRTRPAPPSCSSIGCWNTLVSLGAVLCLPPLFASWWACVPAVGTPLWILVFCRCLRLGELVCPRLERPCEPWCFAGWIRLMLMLQKSPCKHKPLSADLPGVLLMEEILHRCGHISQYRMTSTPAPPVQCCVLKHCAPVQDISHSTSLLLWQIFPTNVKLGARGSRLQVHLVVQDFFHQPYVQNTTRSVHGFWMAQCKRIWGNAEEQIKNQRYQRQKVTKPSGGVLPLVGWIMKSDKPCLAFCFLTSTFVAPHQHTNFHSSSILCSPF